MGEKDQLNYCQVSYFKKKEPSLYSQFCIEASFLYTIVLRDCLLLMKKKNQSCGEREALTNKCLYFHIIPSYYFKLHNVINKVLGEKKNHLYNSPIFYF